MISNVDGGCFCVGGDGDCGDGEVVVVKVDSTGNSSSIGTKGNTIHSNKESNYLHRNVDALNIQCLSHEAGDNGC